MFILLFSVLSLPSNAGCCLKGLRSFIIGSKCDHGGRDCLPLTDRCPVTSRSAVVIMGLFVTAYDINDRVGQDPRAPKLNHSLPGGIRMVDKSLQASRTLVARYFAKVSISRRKTKD